MCFILAAVLAILAVVLAILFIAPGLVAITDCLLRSSSIPAQLLRFAVLLLLAGMGGVMSRHDVSVKVAVKVARVLPGPPAGRATRAELLHHMH